MHQAFETIRWEKDPRTRAYVDPTRIVWKSEEPGALENEDVLLAGLDGQSSLSAVHPFILRNQGSPAGIVLDFGVELHGGVQICVWQGDHPERVAKLRVRFGESVMEAMSDIGGERNATNAHAMRDAVIEVPYLGATEFGNSGFRFVRIDLVDENRYLELRSVRAVFLYRELEYKGNFRCSDPLLNEIWTTGAYTVHLNMQDYLWDGIKRDRLVWTGDMHPETSTIQAVFGDHDIVPRSLDFKRDRYPLPQWMTMPTYSIWWLLIHHDWYMQNGDFAYLAEQRAYLTGLLRQLTEVVGEDGSIDIPFPFLDWPSSSNPVGVKAGVHALFVWAFEIGAKLCRLLGEEETARLCDAYETKLRGFVPPHNGSKQAAALLALTGLMDPALANETVIAPQAPKGYSTFYGYYILKARGAAGDVTGALQSIREYWGGMLSLGATTFWEDFDIDWLDHAARIDEVTPEGKVDVHGTYGGYCYQGYRHSFCHGWASGPTAWLAEYVLGVRVEEPGCRTIRVAPDLGDLDWAEGTYPTPHGIVRIRHERREDGSVATSVEAPEGVTIIR
ncbi:alpha-L-rhamnosidase [Paenibacillus antri]|uniref:Alpha-L-rhamnosidase n=1 Tax=Paenibacillus antri TaxID=2582848 RepID=A0A5R9G5W0_9BACL|nr:alpha-L-rhamnosidase C-terminal domain-containing protein [Paenibacillus antri]TLS49500.1 alpha-L-rhamnosidase [Paenibacillus antri]